MQIEQWMQGYRDQGYAEPEVVTWARSAMTNFDERMRTERGYWFDGDSWQYAEVSQDGSETTAFAISSEEPPEVTPEATAEAKPADAAAASSGRQVCSSLSLRC